MLCWLRVKRTVMLFSSSIWQTDRPFADEVQQTQRQHSTLLQSLVRQMNVAYGQVQLEMPDGMKFPMETCDDVDTVEDKLWESANKNLVVCCFLNILY